MNLIEFVENEQMRERDDTKFNPFRVGYSPVNVRIRRAQRRIQAFKVYVYAAIMRAPSLPLQYVKSVAALVWSEFFLHSPILESVEVVRSRVRQGRIYACESASVRLLEFVSVVTPRANWRFVCWRCRALYSVGLPVNAYSCRVPRHGVIDMRITATINWIVGFGSVVHEP